MISAQVLEHVSTLSPDLKLALLAADAAGEVIRQGALELEPSSSEVQRKGIGDLVSEVDRRADEVAIAVLRESSDLPILSEELCCDVEPQPDMWILDPLDASSAYLMQAGPEYPAVLVALRSSNETHLGVCYFPLTSVWYYAIRGRGAWKNGKRLVCDRSEQLADVWVEMNQYGASNLETQYFRSLNERLRSEEGRLPCHQQRTSRWRRHENCFE